jgi:caffeoyl-CoA O-methyltransferase
LRRSGYWQLAYLWHKFLQMDMIEPLAQAYAEYYSSKLSPLLQEIADYTGIHHPEAQMLSGPLQGKFLEIMSLLLRPRRILEIGTFVGYSALCLSEGLANDGRLHTIELRDADADRAADYFRRANRQDRIILHRGNALAIIPVLNEVWDLVFIDADKVSYVDYYKLVLPRLRSGGLIIADNVLFHGQVLDAIAPEGKLDTGLKNGAWLGSRNDLSGGSLSQRVHGKSAKAIQAFNELVDADETVEKVLLTLRDGLFLIRKK